MSDPFNQQAAAGKQIAENPFAGASAPVMAETTGLTGNEHLTPQDLQTPSIALLQQLSPEVQKGHDRYISGAFPGMFLLKGPGTLLGTHFDCVPCTVRTRHSVWRPREVGGGLLAQYATEAEAMAHVQRMSGQAEYQFSHDHLVLLVQGSKVEPAMIFMNGSKLQTSRKWNTAIRQKHQIRWASVWRVSSRVVQNAKGTFHVMDAEPPPGDATWTPKPVFEQAQDLVKEMEGVKVFKEKNESPADADDSMPF